MNQFLRIVDGRGTAQIVAAEHIVGIFDDKLAHDLPNSSPFTLKTDADDEIPISAETAAQLVQYLERRWGITDVAMWCATEIKIRTDKESNE
jgi:hypothetical protein